MFVTLSFSVSGATPTFSQELTLQGGMRYSAVCLLRGTLFAFLQCFAFSSCADVTMLMFFMMIVSEQTKGHTITEVLRTRRAVECAVRI